jgi:Histidine kinase
MNRRGAFLVMFVFLLLQVMNGHCQEYPMLHFTVEDGLPSNNVYEVYRDSRGYQWFGTDKGIAVYNGLKFEKYTIYDGLPDNEIFFFKEDLSGRLWMSTYNGELCYYKDGVFHTALNTPFLKLPFKTSHIESIVVEADSSVTINFYDQSALLNIYNDRMHVYHLENLLPQELLRTTVYKRKYGANTYELITRSGAVVIDTLGKIDQVLTRQKFDTTLRYSLTGNKDYLFNKDSVFEINGRLRNRLAERFSKIFIHTFYWDDLHNIFITTNDGLYINDTTEMFKGMNVTSVSQGNRGNYWITTLNYGVYCLKKNFQNSRVYRNVYKGEVKFSYTDGKRLFFTTTDDDLYSFQNGHVKVVFDYKAHKKSAFKYSNEASYLIDDQYRYYYFYNNENVILDDALSTRPVVRSNNDRKLSDGIKGIFQVDNKVYVKQRTRIIEFYLSAFSSGNNTRCRTVSDSTQVERILGMAKASDQSIWYSTVNKVYKIENGYGKVQPQFGNVSFKYFGCYGKYLVGYTPGYQLVICSNYSGKDIVIDSIKDKECIWDKIYALDSTHLIISTNNLYRVLSLESSLVGNKFPVMPVENLFAPLRAEAISAMGGYCYFFKNGSITAIEIPSLFSRYPAPDLSFSFLKTTKHTYSIKGDIELPFSESKNMTITFSTLTYSGKDVSYQYSFSRNGNEVWTDIKGEEISLVNSGYGSYEIKVRAKTLSSEYSKPIIFTLNISKPYWATWWFIGFCVLVGIAIVAAIIRYRIVWAIRKKEKAHETEIKFMKSEYKALNALMNPHFIFNTINNVQGLVNRNDKLAANEYLRVFADLIRLNMHNVSKGMIPLQKEMSLVEHYLLLEKLRFKDLLNYSIEIDENVDLSEIMIPPLLVQPLVENSIKHGILPLESGNGFIYIHVYENGGCLHIEVKDNGVGMDRSKGAAKPGHVSFGLENIKKRIEQLSIMQGKEIRFGMSEKKNEKGELEWTIAKISIPQSE